MFECRTDGEETERLAALGHPGGDADDRRVPRRVRPGGAAPAPRRAPHHRPLCPRRIGWGYRPIGLQLGLALVEVSGRARSRSCDANLRWPAIAGIAEDGADADDESGVRHPLAARLAGAAHAAARAARRAPACRSWRASSSTGVELFAHVLSTSPGSTSSASTWRRSRCVDGVVVVGAPARQPRGAAAPEPRAARAQHLGVLLLGGELR